MLARGHDICSVEALWNQYRNTAAYAKDFFKEGTAPGLAATTPSFLSRFSRP
jgi:hypothetical protein